jgi:hypothetical protein
MIKNILSHNVLDTERTTKVQTEEVKRTQLDDLVESFKIPHPDFCSVIYDGDNFISGVSSLG